MSSLAPQGVSTNHDSTATSGGAVSPGENANQDCYLPPPPENKKFTIDLEPFNEALDLLSAGPFRASIYEKRNQIAQGLGALTVKLEAAASAELARIPAEKTASLVRTFLSSNEVNPRHHPLAHYELIANPPFHQDRPSPESYTRMAQSLLSTGLLPRDDIRESIEVTRLSALNQASDPAKSFTNWIATSAVIATWMFNPPVISAIITIGCIALAGRSLKDRAITLNVAEGYILETLDASQAIHTENPSPIGDALNKYFGDPSDRANYCNHWRSDGFVIARALRVLGHPTEKTFELFRDHSAIHHYANELTAIVRGLLSDHEAPVPPSMLVPFIEDPEYGDTWIKTNHLLETLNTVYFANAIVDKEVTRREFAKFIVASEQGQNAT